MEAVLQEGLGLWPKYTAGPSASNDGDCVPVWVSREKSTDPLQPMPGRTTCSRGLSHGSLYHEPNPTAQCDDASEPSPCWDALWAAPLPCDRTRGNSSKPKEGRFRLHVRKTFLTMRLVRPWPRLPRETVVAPSLAVFKARLDGALSNLVW